MERMLEGSVENSWDYADEEWRRVLSTNLDAVFYCTRAANPHMRDRGTGRIVNMASVAGKEGSAGICACAASKAGVIAYTKTIARELATTGVLVNAAAPGICDTPFLGQMTPEHIATAEGKSPMGRFLRVHEVADMVAWIAGPHCTFTTGFVFDISVGRATY